MIEHRPRATFHAEDMGWIRFWSHFPYGRSGGPDTRDWGALVVLGDDEIAPGTGFPLHRHQDMEIITYVVAGALTHRDDQGNSGRIAAGEVQVTSAGSGIRHSEHNHEKMVARLFQIWIRPETAGGAPRWGMRDFSNPDRADGAVILASGFPADANAIPIRTAARIVGVTLGEGGTYAYGLAPDRRAYLVIASGTFAIGDIEAASGDGIAIRDVPSFALSAIVGGECLIIDVA